MSNYGKFKKFQDRYNIHPYYTEDEEDQDELVQCLGILFVACLIVGAVLYLYQRFAGS